MPRVSGLATAAAPGTFYTIEGGVGKKINLGTIAVQNANAVAITGGTINGVTQLNANRGSVGVVSTMQGGTQLGYFYSSNSNFWMSADALVQNAVGVSTAGIEFWAGGSGAGAINGSAMTINRNVAINAAGVNLIMTSTTGTNSAYSAYLNTGGSYYHGVDNSAGTFFSTSNAYEFVTYMPAGRGYSVVEAGTGLVMRANVATGLGFRIPSVGYRTIEVGAASSGGAGYRMLRVLN